MASKASSGPSAGLVRRVRSGFTLIEILIVILILGILAAIVIPMFGATAEDARKTAFLSSLRIFAQAADHYELDNGDWLEDSSTGNVPAGWAPYIDENRWTELTPVGGFWDVETNDNGITHGLGVHFNGVDNPGDAERVVIDTIYDDGDLTTGRFRKIANDRYYHIIEE